MSTAYIPGLAGVPAAESAISFIDGEQGILEYRGIPIQDLAENSTFEETAYLLLFGTLPTRTQLDTFQAELIEHRPVKFHLVDMLKDLPQGGHPMSMLQASVAALGMLYPSRDVRDPKVQRDTAVRLIAKFPTLVGLFHRLREGNDPVPPRQDLSHAANFLYMMNGAEPDPAAARVLDATLILQADHTMNASTFTARVVGSTLTDGYSAISAAVGSLSGPLHGGANEEVLALLHDIGEPSRASAVLQEKLARKEKIMGLGHRVYRVKDPRATILQKLAAQLFDKLGSSRYYDIAVELERTAAGLLGAKGIYPNVDFYSGIVFDKIGVPRDLFTSVFAVSRVSGWCAHWLEQVNDNRIFRPEQIYRGQREQPYVAMNQRG
jgi:citrate synthase